MCHDHLIYDSDGDCTIRRIGAGDGAYPSIAGPTARVTPLSVGL